MSGPMPRRLRMLLCAALPLAIFLLFLTTTDRVQALNPGDVSITMSTDPFLVLDSNNPCTQGPNTAYVGFTVTNTSGGTLTELQASLGGFATGFALAGGQASTQYIGTLAPGASDTLYWYISYPCTTGQSDSLDVTVSDANPGTVTSSATVTTNSTIAANAGGLIAGSTLGPGAVVGQFIPYTVTYSFGGASAGDFYNLQPAGNDDFNAGCFQLVNSEVVASNVTAIPVGATDDLYFQAAANQPGSGLTVSIVYYLAYQCAGTSTPISPYAAQTSGNTNRKYTGNFGTCNNPQQCTSTLPPADPISNTFQISKSASPQQLNGPGVVTFTVRITNTSNFNTRVERFTDTLPANMTFVDETLTSDITSANSSASPGPGEAGAINWIGNPIRYYEIPANSTLTLSYQVNISATSSSPYVNSVIARVGQTQLGPVLASVCVGCQPTALVLSTLEGKTLRFRVLPWLVALAGLAGLTIIVRHRWQR